MQMQASNNGIMGTLTAESGKFYDWISMPFTSSIPSWKLAITVVIVALIAWIILDNLNILKEGLSA